MMTSAMGRNSGEPHGKPHRTSISLLSQRDLFDGNCQHQYRSPEYQTLQSCHASRSHGRLRLHAAPEGRCCFRGELLLIVLADSLGFGVHQSQHRVWELLRRVGAIRLRDRYGAGGSGLPSDTAEHAPRWIDRCIHRSELEGAVARVHKKWRSFFGRGPTHRSTELQTHLVLVLIGGINNK